MISETLNPWTAGFTKCRHLAPYHAVVTTLRLNGGVLKRKGQIGKLSRIGKRSRRGAWFVGYVTRSWIFSFKLAPTGRGGGRASCDHAWHSLEWHETRVCVREWREADRQTIHYIEPLHSRRGLCGHYVYEKGLCGGSWLVVPVNRSLCALGVCYFSVTIGLFYSAFAFDPTRCSAFARVGQSCASILNSADVDVLQDKNHLHIRTLNWSKDQVNIYTVKICRTHNCRIAFSKQRWSPSPFYTNILYKIK